MEAVHNFAFPKGLVLEKDLFHDELLRGKVCRPLHRPAVCAVCLQVRYHSMLCGGVPKPLLLDEEYGGHLDEVLRSGW